MMQIVEIFKKSLKLLLENPKLFTPNLSVALVYALFELVLIKISVDFASSISIPSRTGMEVLSSNLDLIGFLLLSYPVLGALDLITYAMYPSMVSQYYDKKKISLLRALRKALATWKVLLALAAMFILFFLIFTPIMILFMILYYMTRNSLILILGIGFFLLSATILLMITFFVLPIGVIEGEKPLESIRKSYRLGVKYRRQVFALTTFSFLLAILGILIGNINGSNLGVGAAYAGAMLFVLAKLVQSLIYTYISVVNPYFYIHVRPGKKTAKDENGRIQRRKRTGKAGK